jgi:hypothetical protein
MKHIAFLCLCALLSEFSVSIAQLPGGIYNPADGNLYFGHESPGSSGANYLMLFRFENDGSELHVINHPVPGGVIAADGIAGHLFSILSYHNGTREVYETRDSGETWNLHEAFPRFAYWGYQGENPGEGFIRGYSEIPVHVDWVYYTSDSWCSFDSIQIARPDTMILPSWKVYENGVVYGYTVDEDRICISSDTGQTWTIGSTPALRPENIRGIGSEDEFWGWLSTRVFMVQDTGRTTIDSIFVPTLVNLETPWHPVLVPTNIAGEAYLLASREFWFDPPYLEIKLYHIMNYGAQVDSFFYAMDVVYDNAEMHPLPSYYSLSIFPNPFNPSTTISFSLPHSQRATISVYDLTGRRVSTLADEIMSAGEHTVTFDASGLPSGIYFTRMTAGSQMMTKKMVLLK